MNFSKYYEFLISSFSLLDLTTYLTCILSFAQSSSLGYLFPDFNQKEVKELIAYLMKNKAAIILLMLLLKEFKLSRLGKLFMSINVMIIIDLIQLSITKICLLSFFP